MKESIKSKSLSVYLFLASVGIALGLASVALAVSALVHPSATELTRVICFLCFAFFMVALAVFGLATVSYLKVLTSEEVEDCLFSDLGRGIKENEEKGKGCEGLAGCFCTESFKSGFYRGVVHGNQKIEEYNLFLSEKLATVGSIMCFVLFIVSLGCVGSVVY